ncbi:hypothetical protein [Variovorax sp. Sphag1AA]|uniref:hypothetical protein n=1 Tax=Variovorax sp. Sphag1AA TaxID=2587027 RepID=UPI0018223028|nr:hypothetical protein [Variovorax sp. Sphag1AA]MBB3182469.1 phosphoketolase [Variovorax sp. Sphag1AA]
MGARPCLFAPASTRAWAKAVASHMDLVLSPLEEREFEDGEHKSLCFDDCAAIPQGRDRPQRVDELPVEGTQCAHQVPLAGFERTPSHIALLEDWLRSYQPAELFDELARGLALMRWAPTRWVASQR